MPTQTTGETNFKENYERLTEAQKKAVDTTEGPVMVVAGPGSGKTEILSLRVANILRKTDTPPHGILCLTFTDAAAVNMRKRLEKILGVDAYRVAIHTFHSFGTHIIERFPEFFYKGACFHSASEILQVEILEKLFRELPASSPISSSHPEKGYVFLLDAKQSIRDLKQAGISPDEFRNILLHNDKSISHISSDIDAVFSPRMKKSVIAEAEKLRKKMEEHKGEEFPVPHFEPLLAALTRSLERAIDESNEDGKTSPLSKWKRDHTYKNEEGKRALKAEKESEKLHALADLYENYQNELHRLGYYDFEDMILDVIQAIEENDVLRAELQEQFLYVLVDEFQDTNDAQMRLVNLLTSSEMHEGSPNIMVVGDDDQAIYRFQGAEVKNILNFSSRYSNPALITMIDNYRSHQAVVESALNIIDMGEERLVNLMPEIEKTLVSRADHKEGSVSHLRYSTRIHEYHGVVEEVKKLLERGIEPQEIAIIGRKHKNLESLVPFFHDEGIPISYERQQNVLEEPHVRELITMARFVDSLSKIGVHGEEIRDDLLPEILSYPFWGIERTRLWELSLEVYKRRRTSNTWLEVMKESNDKKIQQIADFLIHLSGSARYEPVEYILEALIGAHEHIAADSADEADSEKKKKMKRGFTSPYKEYYFSKERFSENRVEYLRFLSSLKAFIEAIREHKSGQHIKLFELIEFVDVHEKNNLVVTDTSPFLNSEEAVTLTTAHKAKGLEFDAVIILSAQEKIWESTRSYGNFSYPENLPISPNAGNDDDNIRLFYVAATRARKILIFSSHISDDDGKESLPASFLSSIRNLEIKEMEQVEPELHPLLEAYVPRSFRPPYIKDEKALLLPLVENYQLSPTHLSNFLDVTRGGPLLFLEQNLLRFPQPKSPAGVYGSVVHSVLERIYLELKKGGKLPSTSKVEEWFLAGLEAERLSKRDYTYFSEKGKDELSSFFKAKKETFKKDHLLEVNFKREGVSVSGAHLSGKIDKLVIREDGTAVVHDWKTGKPETKWSNSSERLWKYKTQILFYKLLVENSRTYGNKHTVEKGVIEYISPVRGKAVDLQMQTEKGDVERLKKLIGAVYEKIVHLDFPDVSEYPKNLKGVRKFEEDLISGEI